MDHVILKFKCSLYHKEAVMKAAYHFIDRSYVHVDICEDDYVVKITPKKGYQIDDISGEYENELLAQTVRYYVYQQTHTIREILMARAMSSTISGGSYESDSTELPEKVDDLESILMDWFEKNEK